MPANQSCGELDPSIDPASVAPYGRRDENVTQ
jgi:hypothetical protein